MPSALYFRNQVVLILLGLCCCISFGQSLPNQGVAERGFTLLESIRLGLENDPVIAAQKQLLRQAEGRMQAQKGDFDPKLSVAITGNENRRPTGTGTGEDRLIVVTEDGGFNYRTALSKLFRSGLEASAEATLDRSDTKINGTPITNKGDIKIGSSYPLLRGQGETVVTANEVAAHQAYLASLADYDHLVAEQILATVNGYWRYLAAEKTRQIAIESEQRAEKLVQDTRDLVEADQIPRNELLQVRADLANKKSARILAENTLNQARHNLGQIMGLSPAMTQQLPSPSTEFPRLQEWATPPPQASQGLLDKALAQRADLQAAMHRLDASRLDLKVARNDLKPVLDLKLEVGYSGFADGGAFNDYYSALYKEVPGTSFSISLTYELPIKNQSARGNFLASEATNRRSAILTEDLRRSIQIQVSQTANDFYSNFEALSASETSIEFSELALENEQNKFQLGFSTLVDLISFQDKLTSTQRIHISNYLLLMANLTELNFQTGALYLGTDTIDQAYVERIMKPPGY